MSMSRASAKAPPAFCEDLDELLDRALPGTRISANANVGVKRYTKEGYFDDEPAGSGRVSRGSIAGDSGYSSQAATADSGSDFREGRRDRRGALRIDTSAHEKKERRASEARPEYVRRRSSSQAAPSRTKYETKRSSSPVHDPRTCWDCKHRDHYGDHERSHKATRDQSARETRETTQSKTKPPLVRSNSQRSSASRPVSIDNGKHTKPSGYQAPPSAWAIPPSPQYTIPPSHYYTVPTQRVDVPPVVPTPSVPPPMRRATVNHTPMVQPSSYTTPTTPVYSHSPIPDARIPPHYYSQYPIEVVSRRQREEEARRVMPPPPRPGMGRYATTNTIHEYESAPRPRESSTRRSSELEPVSATSVRPPSRTSATYSGQPSRRYSMGAQLTRRTTLDGHEHGRDLEDKLDDVQRYQESRDVNPRLAPTLDAVKKGRASSNAGSHHSRSSRGSGHKSTASGNVTVDAGDCRISINDANRGFSFQKSDGGFRLTFDDEGKPISKQFLTSSNHSSDAAGSSSREKRRSRRMSKEDLALALERLARNPSSSKRSDQGRR